MFFSILYGHFIPDYSGQQIQLLCMIINQGQTQTQNKYILFFPRNFTSLQKNLSTYFLGCCPETRRVSFARYFDAPTAPLEVS